MNTKQTILAALTPLLFSSSLYAQCAAGSAISFLDVNNANVGLLTGGDMWWDLNNSQYEIPKGSGKHTFFANALWFSGVAPSGHLVTAGQQYRTNGNDYWPGPLSDSGTTTPANCVDFDRHWSVYNDQILAFLSGADTALNILEWPGRGNPLTFMPEQDLAPFVDVDNDNIYNPMNGDYPKIKGDQAIYWVFNDNANIHSETFGSPIGIEIHMMAYAYATSDDLNNTTFYNYRVINKSGFAYPEMHMGIFVDGDLGNPNDDYIASDSSRNMAIQFNGMPHDSGPSGYGSNPPQTAIKVLSIPTYNDGSSVPLKGVTSFGSFGTSTSVPSSNIEYYQILKGNWADGTPVLHGGNGHHTHPANQNASRANFMFPIDPSSNWNECSAGIQPGDRRFVMRFDSAQLKTDAVLEFTTAALFTDLPMPVGCTNHNNITSVGDVVQDFHDSTQSCYTDQIVLNEFVTQPTQGQQNGSIGIQVVDGMEYIKDGIWSTGDETYNIANLDNGTYTFVISDVSNCYKTLTVQLGPLSTEDNLFAQGINLFPIPASDVITIALENTNNSVTFDIIDLTGRQIESGIITSNNHLLSVENYEAGSYFIRFESESQTGFKHFIVR